MKRFLLLLSLVCMMAYSCSLDTTRGDALGVGQGFSQQNWQQVNDSGKDSMKVAFIRAYTRINIVGDGSRPFNCEIDVNRPDLMDAYSFPVYTIDTAIWASQPNLSLDQYLRLDETRACFYITWQGRPVYRMVAKNEDGIWIPRMGSMDLSYQGPLAEGPWALEAIEKHEQIIGVDVRYQGLICVYVFKDGKWNRIDPGLRHDEDVMQDLRKGFNSRIMRKSTQARQTDNRPRDLR